MKRERARSGRKASEWRDALDTPYASDRSSRNSTSQPPNFSSFTGRGKGVVSTWRGRSVSARRRAARTRLQQVRPERQEGGQHGPHAWRRASANTRTPLHLVGSSRGRRARQTARAISPHAPVSSRRSSARCAFRRSTSSTDGGRRTACSSSSPPPPLPPPPPPPLLDGCSTSVSAATAEVDAWRGSAAAVAPRLTLAASSPFPLGCACAADAGGAPAGRAEAAGRRGRGSGRGELRPTHASRPRSERRAGALLAVRRVSTSRGCMGGCGLVHEER